jgi:uncharacterized OB-fold protein
MMDPLMFFTDTNDVHRKLDFSGIPAPFWEATRERKLLMQFCPASGEYQFYPRVNSRSSGRRSLQWREVSGEGEIFSFTFVRRGVGIFSGHEPYCAVVITLDVGVNLLSNLVLCEETDVRIGRKVVPYWLPLDGGYHLPLFQLKK